MAWVSGSGDPEGAANVLIRQDSCSFNIHRHTCSTYTCTRQFGLCNQSGPKATAISPFHSVAPSSFLFPSLPGNKISKINLLHVLLLATNQITIPHLDVDHLHRGLVHLNGNILPATGVPLLCVICVTLFHVIFILHLLCSECPSKKGFDVEFALFCGE